MLKRLTIFLVVVLICSSQECMNHKGQAVDWFVILTTPRSVANIRGNQGYHYFDSNTIKGFKYYFGTPDATHHPIYNTLTKLSHPNYEVIAWSDSPPNQTTNGVRAHSKTVVGYNLDNQTGIVLVHSVPKFPFIQKHHINPEINDSQRVFGQHFFCFNSGQDTQQILTKANIMTPVYYANTNNDQFNMTTTKLFQYSYIKTGKYRLKIIFKNGRQNGSIFEDGLTHMLKSNLIAQTWGRPIMPPWCGNKDTPFTVQNSQNITFEKQQISWRLTQDHSKWVVTTDKHNNFTCFGDMNRMPSQFRRGGAFYCIQSYPLKRSMRLIVNSTQISPPRCPYE